MSVSPEGTVADAVDELLFGDRGVEQGVNVEVHQAEEVRDGFLKGTSQHYNLEQLLKCVEPKPVNLSD